MCFVQKTGIKESPKQLGLCTLLYKRGLVHIGNGKGREF